jgi:hypothetical protein
MEINPRTHGTNPKPLNVELFPEFFTPFDNSAKALLFSAICFISPSNIVLMLAICCSSRSTGFDTNMLRELFIKHIT